MERRAFLLTAAALVACKGTSGAEASPTVEPTSSAPKRDPRVRADEPELHEKDLVMDESTRDVDLTGTLEARSYFLAAGCTSPSNLERWLVLAVGERRWLLDVLPPDVVAAIREDLAMRIETSKRRAEARASDAGVTPTIGPPRRFDRHVATPDDAAKLGVRVGQRVRVRGLGEPLRYTGTITIDPIFGVTTDKLEPA
ncbi:MAG TPA: hypothetical protein VGM56_04800 [Byssovorax sp.]